MNKSDKSERSNDPVVRFAAIYEQSSESILRYFLRRLSTSDAAADATADVFVVAWRRIDEVPGGDESRLWLFGVARLTLMNEMRRRRRHDDLTEKLRRELLTSRIPTHPSNAGDLVRAAMAMLSESDRELVMLTSWDGLKPGEAAQVLNIEPRVARVRLHRARRRLRDLLLEPDADVEKRSGVTGTCESQGAAVAPSSSKATS